MELDIFITGQGWREVAHGVTNEGGLIDEFHEPSAPGFYRLNFDIASYSADAFFPSIAIMFEVTNPEERHHLELVLSPYGYSTYRG